MSGSGLTAVVHPQLPHDSVVSQGEAVDEALGSAPFVGRCGDQHTEGAGVAPISRSSDARFSAVPSRRTCWTPDFRSPKPEVRLRRQPRPASAVRTCPPTRSTTPWRSVHRICGNSIGSMGTRISSEQLCSWFQPGPEHGQCVIVRSTPCLARLTRRPERPQLG